MNWIKKIRQWLCRVVETVDEFRSEASMEAQHMFRESIQALVKKKEQLTIRLGLLTRTAPLMNPLLSEAILGLGVTLVIAEFAGQTAIGLAGGAGFGRAITTAIAWFVIVVSIVTALVHASLRFSKRPAVLGRQVIVGSLAGGGIVLLGIVVFFTGRAFSPEIKASLEEVAPLVLTALAVIAGSAGAASISVASRDIIQRRTSTALTAVGTELAAYQHALGRLEAAMGAPDTMTMAWVGDVIATLPSQAVVTDQTSDIPDIGVKGAEHTANDNAQPGLRARAS